LGDVPGEHVKCTAHEADDPVGMPTRSPTLDLVETVPKTGQRLIVTCAASQFEQILRKSREPGHARTALAGALAGHVRRHAGCLGDAAGRRRYHGQDPGADGTSDGGQGSRRVRGLEQLRRQPRSAVPSDENGPDRRLEASLLKNADDWCAHLDLIDTGTTDGAGSRDQARSRSVG
jgi:hypothetical protein